MNVGNRGSVYFLRYTGQPNVKIGFSAESDPFNRVSAYKMYSYSGVELIGYIVARDADKLEKSFHKKHKHKRLNGEWFSITIREAKDEIKSMGGILYGRYSIDDTNTFDADMAKYKENTEKWKVLDAKLAVIPRLDAKQILHKMLSDKGYLQCHVDYIDTWVDFGELFTEYRIECREKSVLGLVIQEFRKELEAMGFYINSPEDNFKFLFGARMASFSPTTSIQ